MKIVKKITRQRLEKFLEKNRTSEKVLDIGAGGSDYDRFFPNRLSIDIDPERKPDMIGDAQNLPFNDEEFEVVICTEVFEHLNNPQKVAQEIYRVLKKGGKLILTTRFIYPLHDTPHDYFRYTKYGLLKIFKDFNEVQITPESGNFSTIAVLLQRICYQTKLKGGEFTKIIIFIVAYVFSLLDFLTKEEFGNIKKSVAEKNILTSGYYLTAKK